MHVETMREMDNSSIQIFSQKNIGSKLWNSLYRFFLCMPMVVLLEKGREIKTMNNLAISIFFRVLFI